MAAPVVRSECQCKFSVISSQQDQHPLHLRLDAQEFQLLFGNIDESTTIGVLECDDKEKYSTGSERLFVVVEKTDLEFGTNELLNNSKNGKAALNSPHVDKNKSSCPSLYCSERFLSHYGYDIKVPVLLRPVQIFPLDRVVVEVTSSRALACAQNKLFSTGLLLSVCQKSVLVRQNDIILAPYNILFSNDGLFDMDIFFDMKVISCDPVQQGRLTVNTEIVIINQKDGADGRISAISDHRFQRKDQENDTSIADTDNSYQAYLLSDFALASKGNRIIPTTDCINLNNEATVKPSVDQDKDVEGITDLPSLRTVVITSLSELHALFNLQTDTCIDDINNSIGLTEKTLCDLGLFDGSFADIEVYDCKERLSREGEHLNKGKSSHTKACKSRSKRTVKVHIIRGENMKDDAVYLSSSLRFNILRKSMKQTGQISLIVTKSPLSTEALSVGNGDEFSSSWSWRGTVPYAGEIHLSVINSPNYAVSTNTAEMLKRYFSTPRLVKKGDVLAISSRLDADYCGMELADGSGSRHPVIYFKVVRIHPSLPAIHTYWVDTKHSVLFQDGAVNSYIPATVSNAVNDVCGVLSPPGMSGLVTELVSIIRPHLHHRRRPEDPVPSILLVGQSGCGKKLITQSVASALNMHLYQVNAHELCGDTSASTEARVKAMMNRATTYAPCIVHLRDINVFGKAADGKSEEPRTASAFHEIIRQQLAERDKWPIVIIASTAQPKQVNLDLYEGFLHQQTVQVPNEYERQEMLREMIGQLSTTGQIDIPHVAQRTAGFVLGDLYALVNQAHRHAQTGIFKYCSAGRQTGFSPAEEEDLVLAGINVTQQDFEMALNNLQSAHSDSIGAPKIPQVSWDDVGGLASVKAEILDTIQLPLQHPELLAAGLRRSGVLLYGPPGTGKTLLAKAVATECSLNFLSVKGPELINMYVGQSEENIREVFHRARSAAPCVIFFDELDSLAPNRGRSGDSGGVMDRVVSQLLAELDGMNKSADVFVIGATNRPDLLDSALLRPGRFDKLLYLGVSEDRAGQLNILKALTRKFELSPGFSLEHVVEQCPINMTGADFYALCSDAMLNAMKRKIALLEQGSAVDQSRVEVEEDDFRDALATLVPSVSMKELARYQSLQYVFNDPKANKKIY